MFILRPIATTLLGVAIALAGLVAFYFLPVSSLPQIEFPTITVRASLPGASPEIMASSIATPLEKQMSAIAGITEMTSISSLGSTQVVMQLDLDKSIDGAARSAQAAINAAQGTLPHNLPNLPTYKKVNPIDGPIMVIALSSTLTRPGEIYDFASSVLSQKLSQVEGIGEVIIGGGSLPAVRIQLNPKLLNHYNISLNDVRQVINQQTSYLPKGQLGNAQYSSEITSDYRWFSAKHYLPLIIAYKNGQPVRLSDLGTAIDSVEDIHNAGMANGEPTNVLILFKQPGANIIQTIERLYKTLDSIKSSIPSKINLTILMDRTTTIRASLDDVKKTMMIALILVVLVVYSFLRNVRATLIPSIAIPLSVLGTFGVMYLFGYSINNLSLMALTIAIGFVVDDAVVVLENIMRHIEQGAFPIEAAKKGAREVSFTVVSMSLSLIAVFIPILLMGGIIGRIFHEFAMTLSIAIIISLFISLSITPMMSAQLIKRDHPDSAKESFLGRLFQSFHDGYARTLSWALAHSRLMLFLTFGAIILNVVLYTVVSKGFFPIQDTGRITGTIKTAQNASFLFNKDKLERFIAIIKEDPAILNVSGYVGGVNSRGNAGSVFITLKSLEDRKISSEEIIARLRTKLNHIPGAELFLQSTQDVSIGGRRSTGLFQYSLTADSIEDLNEWSPKIMERLRKIPEIVDVSSDQLDKGLNIHVDVDRDAASKLGLTIQEINSALYSAFGQSQIATLYKPLNQYHAILEIDPHYAQSPEILKSLFITNGEGETIPFSAFSKFKTTSSLLLVNHQNLMPATTISFSLKPGAAIGDVVKKISQTVDTMNLPAGKIQGSFQGTAKAFEESLRNQPFIILAALVVIYIVLGMLYEHLIHPLTILSTLPSAGVGSLLALMISGSELNVISMIGILLLIGIVKKNAIMMIDFALAQKREEHKDSMQSIYEACMLRFRPIMMTTLSALLSALPLAFDFGIGGELRRPLGIAIIGGLIVSQVLTLYTTPVIYLSLERFQGTLKSLKSRLLRQLLPARKETSS